jgi:hypothetical protein
MNQHLNIFRTYNQEDRDRQLENNLTRAVAICLQENTILLHQALKEILGLEYDTIFAYHSKLSQLDIKIQEPINNIEGAEKIFAVSLTGLEMQPDNFFNQEKSEIEDYKPITDLSIRIDNIIIIFEVKPHDVPCTNQLYNQAIRIDNIVGIDPGKNIFPRDLNWRKLMKMIINISTFYKYTGQPARILEDFITLIKAHNYNWLPEKSFAQLDSENIPLMEARLNTAIISAQNQSLEAKDRYGFVYNKPWAQELLFKFETYNNELCLSVAICPGNTKAQGRNLFSSGRLPVFNQEIYITGKRYEVNQSIHLKFSHFNKYFTSIDGSLTDIKNGNFNQLLNISGRKKRGGDNWEVLVNTFDIIFRDGFDWKKSCNWEHSLVNSGRTYFDLAFGYILKSYIPIKVIQNIDIKSEDIKPLSNFLDEAAKQFNSILLT